MSIEVIRHAIKKCDAKIYASISGGKDGQAMTKVLLDNNFHIHGLIHADLGRVEWKESIVMCKRLSKQFNIPLHVVKRSDGLGLLEVWIRNMVRKMNDGEPFWSSSSNRYCTSDLKRAPINKFFTSTGHSFIISCEGIRAEESSAREKKNPLTIRSNSSTYYQDMTVEEAISNYRPDKKLFLTWYPIFNLSIEDVWNTFGMNDSMLNNARIEYKITGKCPKWWEFHPAYVYGNSRVSCRYCVLGSLSDLQTAASKDNDGLLDELIRLEEESGYTFKNKFSLKSLLPFKKSKP